MADGHISLAQLLQNPRVENRVDLAFVLIGTEQALVADNDSTALLATVLKGITAVIRHRSDVGWPGGVYAENTAFFMNITHLHYSPKRRFAIS